MKFLGLVLQGIMKFDSHIQSLCNKIRFAAARIRTEGECFLQCDRTTLYTGWINGLILLNCQTYLPYINKTQLSKIQTAMNRGIRAVGLLPNRGYAPVDKLRCHLGLLSITEICEKSLLMEAWRRQSLFQSVHLEGPITRARSRSNIPLGNSKGILLNTLSNKLTITWNKMPLDLKTENSVYAARLKIRSLI